MTSSAAQNTNPPSSSSAIHEIARIAHELTGVQLNEKHFSMILSRLHKRLTEVGVANLDQYLEYINKNKEKESEFLVSTLTTHHTYFFRENAHFEFLGEKAIKFLVEKVRARPDKTLRVWSAACSRGQEVYSLAMYISEILSAQYPDIKIDILGTDIDPASVAVAKNGVYPWKEVKEIPLQYLNKNWVRGTGAITEFAKVKASIRGQCRFEPQNLLKLALKNEKPFDIIFCRNVFIYFNAAQITAITTNLHQNLDPEGFLFVGISESLHGLGLPLKAVASSVYVKESHSWLKPGKLALVPKPEAPRNIRVMVVDDSPSIHTLMKQIFTPSLGFEIVARANDGIEAGELLKKTKIDAVTLDIHMPRQDGVEYLRANFGQNHPPVIVVSSVSREDSSLAAQALEIGAADYVEKPALNNLKERAEEIRTKIRCAVRAKEAHLTQKNNQLDKSFQAKIEMTQPETKARVVTFQGSDRKRVSTLISPFSTPNQPSTFLVIDATIQGAELIKNQLEKEIGRRFKSEDDLKSKGPVNGETYILFLSDTLASTLGHYLKGKKTSILATGEPSPALANQIKSLKSGSVHITIEELGDRNSTNLLKISANEISPFTGFHYISDRFLCGK